MPFLYQNTSPSSLCQVPSDSSFLIPQILVKFYRGHQMCRVGKIYDFTSILMHIGSDIKMVYVLSNDAIFDDFKWPLGRWKG